MKLNIPKLLKTALVVTLIIVLILVILVLGPYIYVFCALTLFAIASVSYSFLTPPPPAPQIEYAEFPMELDKLILHIGAGFAAEGFEAIKSGDIINPNEYYGDNRQDHDFVKKGIQMYYEDYPE